MIELLKISTWRCGHAASSVGSSSSGSNSAPVGLDDGGNVLNIFTANWKKRNDNLNVYSPGQKAIHANFLLF